MKRLITSFTLLLASAIMATAQTTATNWTAQDCNSVSHTLFNDLDSGKVVVFAWVMPCAACVNASKTAYTKVQSFATSHPGKVVFYLADDLGDDNCSALTTWITSNNIGNAANITVFENSGGVINENDFGASGMPHIVVMAGKDHKILFNKKNAAANDATGIQNAINTGLTLGINDISQDISFSITPNPVSDHASIKYNNPIGKVIISSIAGQTVKEQTYGNGMVNPTVDIHDIAPGVYMLKAITIDGKSGVQKIIKQ